MIFAIQVDSEDNCIVYDLLGVVQHSGSLYGGHYTAYVKYPTKLDDPAEDDSIVHSWDHEGHSSKQHHFAKSEFDESGFAGSKEFPSESHFALIVLLLTIMTLLFLSLGISLLHLVISVPESGQYHVESRLVHNYPVEVKTGFNESDPGYYNHSTVLKNGPRQY